MTAYEHNYNLTNLRTTCAMNELYHQRMESRCQWWDRSIRIAVMVLAIAGLILAVPDLTNAWIGFGVGIIALIAAAILNIVPVGDWAKHHGEMFRLWCDLRGDADREHLKTCDMGTEEKVKEPRSERLEDLWGKVATLNAAQTSPQERLLNDCHRRALRQLGFDPCPAPNPPSPSAVPAAAAVSGAGASA